MPHPCCQVGSQIPTMSPGLIRGFDNTFWLQCKYCAVVTSNSSECDSMPLKATTTIIEKNSPMSTAVGVGTNVNVKSLPGGDTA